MLRKASALVVGLLLLAAAASAGVAFAHHVRGGAVRGSQAWVVNGRVQALGVSGRILYVGGSFTQVSPRSGPLLAVTAATGTAVTDFPQVEGGRVDAVAGDGAGGWFVGGGFDRVGGVACPNLAHVTGAMSVDRGFCPRPDDAVESLLRDGTKLYVGGGFERIGGVRRSYLASLAVPGGTVSSWAPPAIDGSVLGMALRDGVLYLLGGFGTVGGKDRFTLAAVDVGTRRVTGWDPQAPSVGEHGDRSVESIAASPTAIYVGGQFDQIGGRKRAALAALDPSSGKATAWAPSGQPTSVYALAVAGQRLYAGGFKGSGGYLTAYDLASGSAEAWAPKITGGVSALAVDDGRVYVAADRPEAFDATSATATAWNPPAPNQPPVTLEAGNGVVLFAGSFTGAGGVFRDGLAAIDLRSGMATNWAPTVHRRGGRPEIDAITLSGTTVYVGGVFDRIDGKPRPLAAAVNAHTGAVTAWAPALRPKLLAQVMTIARSKSTIYVGGFGIASAFDLAGHATAWKPKPGDSLNCVCAIAVAKGIVYVGGDFETLNGASRPGLAAVNPRSGAVLAWNPQLGGREVDSLYTNGSTMYVGGDFSTAAGVPRESLASLNVATRKWTGWAPKRPSTELSMSNFGAIAVTSRTVYAGGVGGIAAFDRRTGKWRNWHPPLSGNLAIPIVSAIATVDNTIYVGDDGGLDTFPAPR